MSEWKIQPVCKKCYYRRSLLGGYANGNWRNSVCEYSIIEGKLRGCQPNGEHCDRFRKRTRLQQPICFGGKAK